MNQNMDEQTIQSSHSKQDQEKQFQEPFPSICQAINLISSLISLSYSIKVFAVKWQSIRNKLEELLSSFSAIENCNSSDNPLLYSSIQDISATIKNIYGLARSCLEVSYSGKLLMQSDLDIVCVKLDNHIKILADVYSLGLLTHSYAIVVPRPSCSASRDDIKFYIRDLFSRLKIGCNDMKKQALVAFCEAIQEDDRYVKVAVEVDSFISVLVNFLDSQEGEIQEMASEALSLISCFESCKGMLIISGVIAPLVRVLESGSGLGKEFAAKCLQKLTENSENSWSISAHGGVTALMKICTNEENGGRLIGSACGVLKNLVGVQEIKRFIIDEDAIPLCIKLVRSKDEVTQISSIDLLQTVATGDESIRKSIIKEGGLRALTRVLDPKSSSSSKAREISLRGIMNLCSPNEASFSILMNYGFMDHILYFLRQGEISIQELSLKASFWLCGTSEEAKRAMGDAGFMPELVKFLDSKSFEIRDMAAETISSMLLIPKNRRRFVQNDQNVASLLQLLDPEEANSGNKKLLLSILMSLTSCNSARKKIVSSGYLKNIEKLAEAEVSDAKKIVRKLSTNRFRSILNGIWHS